MQLRSYRELTGDTLDAVADAVGLANASVVHRHERGISRPNATQIERYRAWSKNAITERDWHELQLERERERSLDAATQRANSAEVHPHV
ncbi:hypothetical protein [Sphingobium xenophagum]|uniref:hypothetical protein n=1 Tax=Sphingobium xenophagum TaxID=121428 RepID=UPI000378174C|nr:hypothetical protein [Sphingobium xenophagum]